VGGFGVVDVLRSKLGVNSRMEAGLKPALSGSAAGVGVPDPPSPRGVKAGALAACVENVGFFDIG
jgi:hypothetical protein